MRENNSKVLGWGTIIAIMVGVGVIVGLALGLLRQTFGFSLGATASVGASVGAVGAILIARRRAALAQQKND